MEETSSTKEETAKGAWSFHGAVRAILRCLGLEPEFHRNPSCQTGEVNNSQAASCQEPPVASYEEGPHPSSTSSTDYSDPPSTARDPAADPFSTIEDPRVIVSLSTPKRPGTSSGRGSQIN